MGYYENPPIIQPGRGSEMISASIAGAANSIAEALIKKGERKREQEKENKLTIQKLQEQKNKTDLFYNEKLSDWATKNKDTGNEVDSKVRGLLQQKIQLAADAHIALTMETDPTKRASYLKTIKDADTFMSTAAEFSKNVAMDTATWRENTPGIAVGKAGGWVINGKDAREINARTGAVEILGGMTNAYDSHAIDIIDEGGTFSIKVRGKRKDSAEAFDDVVINANSYLNSDKEGAGGFLQKVENIDEFHTNAKKGLLDEKGGVLPTFFNSATETAYVESVGDKYKLEFAKRLDVDKAMSEIRKQAEVRASGYLRADKEASLRTLLNYTLGKGPEYYDKEFKGTLNPEQQQQELANILSKDVFDTMTLKFEKTTGKNGETIYWGGDQMQKTLEAKKTKGGGGGGSGLGSGSGLTANKVLEMQELEANATKQRKKLANIRDTKPVYSPDNSSRIIWDPASKEWVYQIKSSSNKYETDLQSGSIRSKNKAAQEFLGYGLP